MAFYATSYDTVSSRSSLAWRLLRRLGKGIEAQGDTLARRAQIAALEAKTDIELAQLGLSRDQIVPYVFRDLYYI